MASAAALPDGATLGAVAVGGVLGSLGRWAVGLALPHEVGAFPWSTFVVNVTGAFAMGLLVAFLVDRPGVHRLARPFVGVGVLGGWTTFSALAVDAVQLGATHHVQLALLYVGATFLVGTLAVAAGMLGGRRVWPGP
ncbi:CrcB family protein [Phycicoccus sp. MAQZ13P-2]|uniref:fluoride efflux transporter FluC n=1 Tax=Phycicoccus mangrovi TaxID=2840470 RepID=UPI001C0011B8|nr:CrcB family protein [Phycicoccus mangrovi]MBT9256233.1 CrcB family protein [Phycicoccus mangrovi]MBT9273752.1 CrcB family protein [Phycicoccus mangrovi]